MRNETHSLSLHQNQGCLNTQEPKHFEASPGSRYLNVDIIIFVVYCAIYR